METASGMDLIQLLITIQNETCPIDGHTDPGAIHDCWNEVFDTIKAKEQEINELKTMLNDVKVHNMAMENGEINMTIEGPNARNLFASIVQAFRQNGGKNFFAVDMEDRNTGESFTVIIQKNNGITPTQRMNIQEEQIKALAADKDELAGRLMQYDAILKQAREALQDSIAYGLFKDDFNFRKTTCYEAIKKVTNSIDTLLGGKENGKM